MSREDYRIELFVFPDGSEVEMIVFDRPARTASARSASGRTGASRQTKVAPPPCRVQAPPPSEDPDAGRCPACGSALVYPVDWERSGPAAWSLLLRCPDCETRRTVTLGRESVEHLNRELYRSAQALAREADRVARRNFEDDVDRIVAALRADLILPMDF
ncbi:MAG: hypothetical protein GX624_07495 [Actinobacteria bacterium]|nr:hypothetical protein [Actinomycetota bacterium]